ncbi:E3 ubiquitin-protein ligase RNF185-like [Drosophila innubila]|uniref:E3 ubiquitin-protein ligase RNF185-like n=1 Tax=Drosophila innubila TaxID=198719 RepID=UPI00148DFFCF|nr:E3 ubiquitin-protein ligase RNF185-like [Drosophila innubila]
MCGSWNSTMSSGENSSRRSSSNSSNNISEACCLEEASTSLIGSNISQVHCIICLESYKSVDNICVGSCGHVFHWKCLKRWKKNSEQCPICRSTSAEYIPIYLNFEDPVQCQNLTQGQSQSSEFENMLYEAALYRDEIKYLNERINKLTLKKLTTNLFNDSSSDSD